MAKIGVIYLSISGNTTAVARWLKEMDSDILLCPIVVDESIPRTKVMQVIKYGYKTVFNRTIDYSFDENIVETLDGVIIGAPIWMGRIPSPVRDIISKIDLQDKSVAGYCTYDGDPADFKDQLYAFTDSSPFTAFISLKEPLKHLTKDDLIKLKDMLISIHQAVDNKETVVNKTN